MADLLHDIKKSQHKNQIHETGAGAFNNGNKYIKGTTNSS